MRGKRLYGMAAIGAGLMASTGISQAVELTSCAALTQGRIDPAVAARVIDAAITEQGLPLPRGSDAALLWSSTLQYCATHPAEEYREIALNIYGIADALRAGRELRRELRACGTERWSIKMALDPDADQVAADAKAATVEQLIRLPAPADLSSPVLSSTRVAPAELTTYSVSGILTVIKRETDRDYHLVIAAPRDRRVTMIAEAPDPDCAGGNQGRFSQDIAGVRQAIEREFGPITGRREPNIRVTVTGIAFFDTVHGQEGVAPNGIELHPLRSIHFD